MGCARFGCAFDNAGDGIFGRHLGGDRERGLIYDIEVRWEGSSRYRWSLYIFRCEMKYLVLSRAAILLLVSSYDLCICNYVALCSSYTYSNTRHSCTSSSCTRQISKPPTQSPFRPLIIYIFVQETNEPSTRGIKVLYASLDAANSDGHSYSRMSMSKVQREIYHWSASQPIRASSSIKSKQTWAYGLPTRD